MPISTASNLASVELLERGNISQLPTSLLGDMRRVFSVNEDGILAEELLDKYFKVTGRCLQLSDYGLSLKDLVACLSSSLGYVRKGKIFLKHKHFLPHFPIVEQATTLSKGWVEVLMVEGNVVWVRGEESLDHLEKLEEEMERQYCNPGTSLLPEQILANLCVACLHPEMAVWCRGKVVSVRGI